MSIDELKEMTNDPDLLWSPWFRGILDRGGFEWWADLDGALRGEYTNEDVVFFDATPEHFANYNLPEHTRMTGVLTPENS